MIVKRYGDDAILEAAGAEPISCKNEGDMGGAETWHRNPERDRAAAVFGR